jgi:signal transduction histidine kinase
MASPVVKFREGLIEAERLKSEIVEYQVAIQAAESASAAKSANSAQRDHGLFRHARLGVFATLSDRCQEYVKLIHRAGQHLLELICDILDSAKIESGRFELSIEHADMDKIVSECIGSVSPKASAQCRDCHIGQEEHLPYGR